MKHSKKILTKIILSYGIMVCIPFLISIVVYYFTYGVVKEQTEAYNSKLINVIQSSCDSELRYYKSVLEQLKGNGTVQELGRSMDHNSGVDSWNYYLVKEELVECVTNIRTSNAYCYDLFVWYQVPDKVVNFNSSMPWHIYVAQVLNGNEAWSESLKSALTTAKYSEVIGLKGDKNHYILLLEPVIGININKGDVVAGIWIDSSVMDMKVDMIDGKKGIDWMLLDSEGRILRSPQSLDVSGIDGTGFLAPDGTHNTVEVDGKTYLTSVRNSDFYDMKYVLFSPENAVNSPAKRIRTVNFVSLFIMLLTGFLTATYFTQMHYHPLKSLLQYFQNRDEKSSAANEYEYLEHEVFEMVRKSANIQNEHRSMVRLHVLERLLLARPLDENLVVGNREILDKFREGNNLVLMCCEKREAVLEEPRSELIPESWLRRYIVANVFEEGIGEYFRQETFEYNDKVVILIHMPDSRENCMELLQAEVERLQEFIHCHYQFVCCILEGGMHEGLEGIHYSWLEACQAEEFVHNLEEQYIRYDEIRDQTVRDYTYSSELEACILNALRDGDAKAASAIVDQLVETCFSGSRKTVSELQTCMLYDIFGTLLKASDEQGIRVGKLPKLNFITTATEPGVIQEYFHEVIEDICAWVLRQLVSEQGKELSEEILEYIREHYSDPDLNISQIAYQFQMTPAWISVAFKKQTGRSLLNVIKQVRIENAKRLLNDGLSVLEVSDMAGFRESSTFIRIFKSCTGVTPGQYKKVNQMEHD